MTRTELIQNAIADAYEAANKATIVNKFNNGTVTTRYYRKGKRIWCREVCGNIVNESCVYAVNTKPYVRWMGRKWYLDGEALEAMKTVL